MKGYYIFFGTNSTGVLKKVDMQIKALSTISQIEKITVFAPNRTLIKKIRSRLPWCSKGYDYEPVLNKIENPDYLYVRRTTADAAYIDFFTKIKKTYPNCKIIIEIFTYPYYKDEFCRNLWHCIISLPFFWKDYHYRKKLKTVVDRFVTYSKDKEIFGVPTILTTNGTDVESIIPCSHMNTDINTIHLISVAQLQVHHGYERLIKGLGYYYRSGGTQNIIYHAVGSGSELDYYKKLAKTFNIQSHIIFYGQKTGPELDAIYNNADIAIASLGLYKYGIKLISTLKNGEYLAKGLPIVTGCKINLLNSNNPPYICEFEGDATPLDINQIIGFYHAIYDGNNRETIINEIRDYAKKTCDISSVMKPIINFILQER